MTDSFPSDLAAAHAIILAERSARLAAEGELASACADLDEARAVLDEARAEAAKAQADRSSHEALIAHLKLEIEKLRRQLYGQRSERTARLLDQMELQLGEVEASATEDELAAEQASSKTTTVRSFQRKRPVRKPFLEDIERKRVVIEHEPAINLMIGAAMAAGLTVEQDEIGKATIVIAARGAG